MLIKFIIITISKKIIKSYKTTFNNKYKLFIKIINIYILLYIISISLLVELLLFEKLLLNKTFSVSNM